MENGNFNSDSNWSIKQGYIHEGKPIIHPPLTISFTKNGIYYEMEIECNKPAIIEDMTIRISAFKQEEID